MRTCGSPPNVGVYMRAIQISKSGGVEVLEIANLPTPSVSRGQLLVKTQWAGVNYIDIYQRTGRYPLTYPVTLGLEGSGEVVQLGDEVEHFKVGDRIAWPWAQGSYAEFVLVPAELAFNVPKDVSLESATALMMQALTAHYLTRSVFPAQEGDTALVHAAAGGMGLLLCQMLSARGVRVIGTVSSDQKKDLALSAGATEIIRYDQEDFAPAVSLLTNGEKCRVVYDSVGATTFEGSLASLTPRGTLVLYGASSGAVPPFDLQRLSGLGSLVITRPTLGHFIRTAEELRWRCGEVFEAFEKGTLKISIANTFDLAQAGHAHIAIESRLTSGKLLLRTDLGQSQSD